MALKKKLELVRDEKEDLQMAIEKSLKKVEIKVETNEDGEKILYGRADRFKQ